MMIIIFNPIFQYIPQNIQHWSWYLCVCTLQQIHMTQRSRARLLHERRTWPSNYLTYLFSPPAKNSHNFAMIIVILNPIFSKKHIALILILWLFFDIMTQHWSWYYDCLDIMILILWLLDIMTSWYYDCFTYHPLFLLPIYVFVHYSRFIWHNDRRLDFCMKGECDQAITEPTYFLLQQKNSHNVAMIIIIFNPIFQYFPKNIQHWSWYLCVCNRGAARIFLRRWAEVMEAKALKRKNCLWLE